MPTSHGMRHPPPACCRRFSGLVSYRAASVRPTGTRRPGVTAMISDNIFQKIIDRKIKADIVYEDDRSLAFRDINAQAPVHVLIIPKKVIATHDAVTDADRDLLGHLHQVAVKLAGQLGLQDGYRLVINC